MDGNTAPSTTVLSEVLGNLPVPIVKFLHSALGLADLDRLYRDAVNQTEGRAVGRAMLDLLGVDVRIQPGELRQVPATGPVIIVSNHPFGFLDGLILEGFLSPVRPDL